MSLTLVNPGKPVMTLEDFQDAEVFIAYGTDRPHAKDDFDLELIEFK